MDHRSTNRSRFIQEAVRHEIVRLRREELNRSLASPHPESSEMEEVGVEEWDASLPEDDAADLVDLDQGTEIRWIPSEGWTEVEK